MKKASIRELRCGSKGSDGCSSTQEVSVTKGRRAVAKLIPATRQARAKMPDFMKRLRSIYGKKLMPTTGAEIVAEDRNR